MKKSTTILSAFTILVIAVASAATFTTVEKYSNEIAEHTSITEKNLLTAAAMSSAQTYISEVANVTDGHFSMTGLMVRDENGSLLPNVKFVTDYNGIIPTELVEEPAIRKNLDGESPLYSIVFHKITDAENTYKITFYNPDPFSATPEFTFQARIVPLS